MYYTGRAPLEAAAMGVVLGPDDWAVRCNLMTIEDGRLTDFTAGHITTEEGRHADGVAPLRAGAARGRVPARRQLSQPDDLSRTTGRDPFADQTITDPPHDHPDQPADEHLPRGPGAELLRDVDDRGDAGPCRPSRQSRARSCRQAARPTPSGSGARARRPACRSSPSFAGLKGAIISAVDLVRGVAVLAGWNRIDVPGATGYLDTDYAAKGLYAIKALADHDIVCVHVEAPDEASHEGRADAKVEAIERIDHDIVAPVFQALQRYDQWRILVSPDHSTLLRTRAHDRAPVAWTMAGTGLPASGLTYDEYAARDGGGPFLEQGFRLMDRFVDLEWRGQRG